MNEKTLKEYIDEKGMSVTHIAEEIGIDRSTLYNKLAGGPEFTSSEIENLAEALNLTIEKIHSLIDRRENERKPKKKIIFEDDILRIKETGRNFNFIATIENKSKNRVQIIFHDEDLEPILIAGGEWIGIQADSQGAFQIVEIIKGHFDSYELKSELNNIEKRTADGEHFEGVRRIFENYEEDALFTGTENGDNKPIESTIRIR